MDIGSALAQGPLRMSEDELRKTEEYVKTYNAALRAERKGGTQEMGKDDFLRLLITQLRYQDPLKPMEDKEFIAQMAQFSSLEQTKNMADALAKMNENLTASQERNNALSFLGKYVEVVRDDGKVETGRVDSIDPRSGLMKVNGQFYGSDRLIAVTVDPSMNMPVAAAAPAVNAENAVENEVNNEEKQNIVEGDESL